MNTNTKKVLTRITSLVPVFLVLVAVGFLFAPMLTISFDNDVNSWDVTYNIISFFQDVKPLHFTMIGVLLLLVAGIVFAIIYKENKAFGFISVFCFAFALFTFVSQGRFYEYNNVPYYDEGNLAWGGIVFSIILFVAIFVEFVVSYQKDKMSIRDIAEDGMLIALALVLNFVKIPMGATGGSINLQMLPLFLIALRHGPIHGFIAAGIVYGFISNLADMYPLSCYPFDYVIGFGGVAVMGIFSHWILDGKKGYNALGELLLFIGGVLATLIRWTGSSISSVVNYNVTFVEGLAYNIIYILPSGLICTAVMMAAYGPIVRLNNLLNRTRGYSIESED